MISFEEAYKIAKEVKPNTDCYYEYENGWMFGSNADNGYVGGYGHTPVVVLKKDGKTVNMMTFVNMGTGKDITGTDEMIQIGQD